MSGTGVIIKPHLDANGKDLAIEHWQDCEDIIERNKQLRNTPQKSDWGRHIASIPNVILLKWMQDDGVDVMQMRGDDFGKYIKRKLSDPDWAHLRVDK
jgi:hypothetical protein